MTTFSHTLRGQLPAEVSYYGNSVLGAPLLWYPALCADACSGLIIAGIHGDENAPIATLSCALRVLSPQLRRHHIILCVNPDGCQSGLHANYRGIDLNRNFPAANWQAGETIYRCNSGMVTRDFRLSTGERAGSEPETRALCELIRHQKPRWVVSFHNLLGRIGDASRSPPGLWLAKTFKLPLVNDAGYMISGSFRSWCHDINLTCISADLPPGVTENAGEDYLDAMVELLRFQA